MKTNWIDLAGVVNMRDLGGRTTEDGRVFRSGVVLRSDNLGALSDDAQNTLLSDYSLSDVIDLRTNRELQIDPAWPFGELVKRHHLSLYPEDDPSDPLPPWAGEIGGKAIAPSDHAHRTANHYLGYFKWRPENLVEALRTVISANGATIINCAAGKDRTGTTCAVLLKAVGIPDDQVIEDYAESNAKVPAILERLGQAAAAGSAEMDARVSSQSTPAKAMELLLGLIEEKIGGLNNWLDRNGWTQTDQNNLEEKVLG